MHRPAWNRWLRPSANFAVLKVLRPVGVPSSRLIHFDRVLAKMPPSHGLSTVRA
jgi:hypothetical protein